MSQENIAQNAQQQFEENISSMIGNDGELSMQELDSVAGGRTTCVYSSKSKQTEVWCKRADLVRPGDYTKVKIYNANDLV
jgi:hypothetical protein